MRPAIAWTIGAALALGAGVVTAAIPSDEDLVGPFVHSAAFGEPVQTRALTAIATDATFADAVGVEYSEWSAEGNWLVVTLSATATTTEIDATVQLATLAVGDRVFQASERPSASLRQTQLRIGVTTTGQLAFELPPDVDTGTAQLRLTNGYVTPELDDLAVIDIPLGDLPRADEVVLVESEWSER